jgi:outer membrane protein TolC
MKFRIQVTLLVAAALTTGCMVGPSYKMPELQMQSHWTAAESPAVIEGAATEPITWWESFEDPVLTGLVKEALDQNLDLEAAGLRIVQARSAKVRAKWLLAPILSLDAGYKKIFFGENVRPEVEVQRGNLATLASPLAGAVPAGIPVTPPKLEFADDISIYNAGATALWEADLWGGTRRRIRSGSAMQEAMIAQYDNVAVVVVAEVAATYIQLRTLDARIAQLDRNIELLAQLAGSQGQGSVGEGNRSLAESLLGDSRSRLVDLRTARKQYENALCVLLGSQPGTLGDRLGTDGEIPAPPPEIAIGMPTDLLRRRPDVREAERLAAAQCERIGVVKSRLYPSFRLLGGFGLASSNSSNFFESDSTRGFYGVDLSWNILLYPFIQERVRIEDARYQEALVNFENVVIRAAAEAENSLVGYVNALEKTTHLGESARAAESAAETRLAAALDNPASFDAAFMSLEYRLSQCDKLIEAQGEQSLGMVRLYAALGGGWEVQQGLPLVTDEAKEAMRDRTDWWSFGGKKGLEQTR